MKSDKTSCALHALFQANLTANSLLSATQFGGPNFPAGGQVPCGQPHHGEGHRGFQREAVDA